MYTLPIEPITNKENANAFLLGIVFNQNQKAERSWVAPRMLWDRLGTSDPETIGRVPLGCG